MKNKEYLKINYRNKKEKKKKEKKTPSFAGKLTCFQILYLTLNIVNVLVYFLKCLSIFTAVEVEQILIF